MLSLQQPVAPLIDPLLQAMGLASMISLWGAAAANITVSDLATMRSGIPDFDTANPSGSAPTDKLRAKVYARPNIEHPPVSLLNLSWVATGSLKFPPGERSAYSSTNFVLLGLLLDSLQDSATWDSYNQSSVFQRHAAAPYENVKFAVHGSPASHHAVPGYDRTSYNGGNASARPGIPVAAVAGVFSGWTASDLIASVADIARLGYDLFGTNSSTPLLSVASVTTMIPTTGWYGFATFNLTIHGLTGHASAYGRSYGHLGATYGYDSILAYFPALDLSIAVASSLETDSQAQPSDVICSVYNTILAHVLNVSAPTCTFVATYHRGTCRCSWPAGRPASWPP